MSQKILLVDDEPLNLDLLEQELGELGYAVAKAEGGRAALDMLATVSPDLILLDYQMPGMNGFEVLDRLAQSPVTQRLPVIIFTVKQLTVEDKQRLQGRAAWLAQKDVCSGKEVATMVQAALQRTLGERG